MFGADLGKLAAALRTNRAVLLGVGNPWRGDDGAGLFLIDLLAQRLRREAFLFLAAGENPENYLQEIKGFSPKFVIFFDAVRSAGEAGEIGLIQPELIGAARISTHAYGLPILLAYLEQDVGCRTFLVGIAGRDFALRDHRLELSPPVRAGIEAFAGWFCERL